MIYAHIVDSCGKSGDRETPQEWKRRGGSRPARGKRRYACKSTAILNKTKKSGKCPLFLIGIYFTFYFIGYCMGKFVCHFW
ncbi:MAG: hypothetical protein LPK00_06380 [Bacillaceae bacterium]|nr:hypothetical protein [Bacillaceae bacterium]